MVINLRWRRLGSECAKPAKPSQIVKVLQVQRAEVLGLQFGFPAAPVSIAEYRRIMSFESREIRSSRLILARCRGFHG